MSKKIYVTLAILVVVIILGTVFFIIVNERDCKPYANIGSERNIESCRCIDDETERRSCEENISGADSYTQAVRGSDLTACNDIKVEEMKDACINVVQGKIDFINKQ